MFKHIADVTTQQASKSCRVTIVYPNDGSVPAHAIPLLVSYYDNSGGVAFQARQGSGNVCPTGGSAAIPAFIVDSTTTATEVHNLALSGNLTLSLRLSLI